MPIRQYKHSVVAIEWHGSNAGVVQLCVERYENITSGRREQVHRTVSRERVQGGNASRVSRLRSPVAAQSIIAPGMGGSGVLIIAAPPPDHIRSGVVQPG